MTNTRKTPMRTCVGCRACRPKKELIRVVRTPEGETALDATGRKSGRGAYICPNEECLKKAQKSRALERALEHKIEQDVFDRLLELLKGEAQ